MNDLRVTLECTDNVKIVAGTDILKFEKGETVEGRIDDFGIRIKINEICWSARCKPSTLAKYFKMI